MKLAVAGKGGVGKTTLTVLLGEHLARLGQEVWLVDADSSPCLGPALGLPPEAIPSALAGEAELVAERVGGGGMICLNPDVADLPARFSARAAGMTLLVMGSVAGAGAGCACAANALVKSLLAHVLTGGRQWVLVDLEAGVEHLGRGTAESVDGLVVVSEPSLRGLETAANVSRLARELGINRQALVLNRAEPGATPPATPALAGLPPLAAVLPRLASLEARQLASASALSLDEREAIDQACRAILATLSNGRGASVA